MTWHSSVFTAHAYRQLRRESVEATENEHCVRYEGERSSMQEDPVSIIRVKRGKSFWASFDQGNGPNATRWSWLQGVKQTFYKIHWQPGWIHTYSLSKTWHPDKGFEVIYEARKAPNNRRKPSCAERPNSARLNMTWVTKTRRRCSWWWKSGKSPKSSRRRSTTTNKHDKTEIPLPAGWKKSNAGKVSLFFVEIRTKRFEDCLERIRNYG